MTRFGLAIVAGLGLAIGAVQAAPLDRSPIPKPRPVIGVPVLKPVFGPGSHIVRPQRNPRRIITTVSTAAVATARAAANAPLAVSLFPKPRPALKPYKVSAPVQVAGGKVGPICGRRDIQGVRVADIRGSQAGCGVSDPVQVIEVSGVRLSTAATMDCNTAKALNEWVEDGLQPAVGRLGGGVSSLKVAASYVCRTRNHQPGAKLSEHGKGKAIDISAITLSNGKVLSVQEGWDQRADGKILKKAHAAACGPFGTVLGPDADRFHKDHFHFDTAKHGNGNYCR
ncbi:hypothetical protein ACMU_15270 [Actibacterium mucosum KCTC 23349]|uniref:Extensin-like C-terminal domain-containing protein n=1 Tax=Actibacterium mucosum KCTC 23349 TaxID=1454373 RepID=A0A037ZHK6_9RHOB|nr:extensin family protein [Actibacterium mucosum]KAJ55114.1 hypothetical protein ACMU_15270 [Actibacterium mucosum KCTC 23349]